MKNEFYTISSRDTLEILKSDKQGLTDKEALVRTKKYGLNEMPRQRKETIIEKFVKEIIDPIIILLIVAAILSFFSGEIIDGISILAIVLIDAIVGVIQEVKAEKSAESLQKLIQLKTKVLRMGKIKSIDTKDITIGDIIILESGDKVSADARILESKNLTVDESILTGESISVSKNSEVVSTTGTLGDRINMLYAGTSVITGRAKAIVTDIGKNTEIGKIASTVSLTKDSKSPLTIRMEKFSRQISLFIIITAIIIATILVAQGQSLNAVFLSVVALAVSSMPEGLPLALTMALTVGSTRMAKKNVIVKKLEAVESLGSCTVIASDKTGTLTVNAQTAKKIVLPNDTSYDIEGSGYNADGKIIPNQNITMEYADFIAKLGVINNEANLEYKDNKWEYTGDSIDVAFKALGLKAKIDLSNIELIDNIPYESELKYSAALFKENDRYYQTVKGATDVVLNFCKYMKQGDEIVKLDRDFIEKQNETLSMLGFRVIAIAYSEETNNSNNYSLKDIKDLTFAGLVAFIDPIRKESKKAIKMCKDAGIKVVMITGDHPLTAFAIGKELTIASTYDEVAKSSELDDYYDKGDLAFDEYIKDKTIFTRVTPIQKLHIVESFKRQGEFVAVTGDGVNDAPAIKSANVGIAMGSSTDVCKEVASMIITDDNFMSIALGIKEGRAAYSNIRKVVYFLLSCGVAEILFFLLAIILNLPMPLIAIQLLWLNVVTDGFQDMALSLESENDDIMKQKPKSPKDTIFNKEMISEILVAGLYTGILVFICFAWTFKKGIDISICRGCTMTLMVFIQNIHVLNCKSERLSVLKVPLSKNKFMLMSILISIILQIIIMEIESLAQVFGVSSIPVTYILILFLISTSILLVMEIYKSLKARW